jgi:hypothetical protein
LGSTYGITRRSKLTTSNEYDIMNRHFYAVLFVQLSDSFLISESLTGEIVSDTRQRSSMRLVLSLHTTPFWTVL